jgi:Fe-S oxidoreductase
MDPEGFPMILEKLLGQNVLYYPGCLTKFSLVELAKNYERILRRCGIDFIKLDELEVCCGSPARNAGYFDDFKSLARENFRVFKEHRVGKIITNCPACFKVFSQDYPKVIGEWNIEVEHACMAVLDGLRKGRLIAKRFGKATYHDPCHLARYGKMCDEPRRVLELIGLELVEMRLCREMTLCCGGGGGLRANFPELSEEIAKERAKQAKRTGAGLLVTCCPMCYLQLRQAAKGIEVKELSQLFS